jgi:hypothetical protein
MHRALAPAQRRDRFAHRGAEREVGTSPIQIVSAESIHVSGKTDISDIITRLGRCGQHLQQIRHVRSAAVRGVHGEILKRQTAFLSLRIMAAPQEPPPFFSNHSVAILRAPALRNSAIRPARVSAPKPKHVFLAARRTAPIGVVLVFAGAIPGYLTPYERQARRLGGEEAPGKLPACGLTAIPVSSNRYRVPPTALRRILTRAAL